MLQARLGRSAFGSRCDPKGSLLMKYAQALPPGGGRSATLRGVEIVTSDGVAHVALTAPAAQQSAAGVPDAGQAWTGAAAFLLVLTHGAGGGVDAPDLRAARDAALRLGGAV